MTWTSVPVLLVIGNLGTLSFRQDGNCPLDATRIVFFYIQVIEWLSPVANILHEYGASLSGVFNVVLEATNLLEINFVSPR